MKKFSDGFHTFLGLFLWFLRPTGLLSGAETDLSLGEAKMDLLVETIGIAGVVILGVVAGGVFSRLRRGYWAVGYLISIILIGLLLAAQGRERPRHQARRDVGAEVARLGQVQQRA